MAYILRTCDKEGRSYGGFQWPREGPVEAPNWIPGLAQCGNGLHGLLNGAGDQSLLSRDADALWLVAEVPDSEMVAVDDGRKYVFPRAWVVCCGDLIDARMYMLDRIISAAERTAKQSAASGYYSQSAARGYSSQSAASGDSSQSAASGDSSQSAARGYYSQSAARGYSSQSAASGDYSQSAASGDSSQSAASGYYSQSAARGYSSQSAASGDSSQSAASGYYSVALAQGFNCRVRGTAGCALLLTWIDEAHKTIRVVTAYVGEAGITADTWYRLNDDHEFEEVA